MKWLSTSLLAGRQKQEFSQSGAITPGRAVIVITLLLSHWTRTRKGDFRAQGLTDRSVGCLELSGLAMPAVCPHDWAKVCPGCLLTIRLDEL